MIAKRRRLLIPYLFINLPTGGCLWKKKLCMLKKLSQHRYAGIPGPVPTAKLPTGNRKHLLSLKRTALVTAGIWLILTSFDQQLLAAPAKRKAAPVIMQAPLTLTLTSYLMARQLLFVTTIMPETVKHTANKKAETHQTPVKNETTASKNGSYFLYMMISLFFLSYLSWLWILYFLKSVKTNIPGYRIRKQFWQQRMVVITIQKNRSGCPFNCF